jgi:hypothetical protein
VFFEGVGLLVHEARGNDTALSSDTIPLSASSLFLHSLHTPNILSDSSETVNSMSLTSWQTLHRLVCVIRISLIIDIFSPMNHPRDWTLFCWLYFNMKVGIFWKARRSRNRQARKNFEKNPLAVHWRFLGVTDGVFKPKTGGSVWESNP